MKEKLYTIDLNDAVQSGDECLFCWLERKLEQSAIEFALGSSYMESDVRDMTDRQGFCRSHTKKMFDYGNALGNAWILKSRMEYVRKNLKEQTNQYKPSKSGWFGMSRKNGTEGNGVTAWIDQLTVEQSLYGFILKSANEIGNGLAEHISGSNTAFAAKMNERAKQLGCQNTNFANPHGLNNTEHKTTPYDMAMIAREAFKHEAFRKIDTTLTYQFPATKKSAARTITMGHKMMYPSDARYYEGIIGGKTGYTSKAGNTLVTGAERNGVQLIVVIMKSNSTHYTDTKALLDYGFENYEVLTGNSASNKTNTAGPDEASQAAASKWYQDSTGWYYIKSDGRKARNEWLTDNGDDYWFDSNEYMATGWRQFHNGTWYYFKGYGAMAKNYWVETEGAWFYLGDNGVMLTNAQTPDGHQVNEFGVWIQN